MSLRALMIALLSMLTLGSGCSASYSSDQGKTLSPPGAFYSFKVPQGFLIEDASQLNRNPYRQTQSGVASSGSTAVVRVSQQSRPLKVGSVAATERAFIAQARRWTVPATAWKHIAVAGSPALQYELSSNGVHEREIAVFERSHIFYVSCLWEHSGDEANALDGCRKVVRSLALKH